MRVTGRERRVCAHHEKFYCEGGCARAVRCICYAADVWSSPLCATAIDYLCLLKKMSGIVAKLISWMLDIIIAIAVYRVI